ncbi:hypothetical protein N9119_03110 [Roseivirga sp.]|nr:hypothetical protein [Roseivirga sp.]
MTDSSSVSSASLPELAIYKNELDRIIVEAQEKVKLIKSELEGRYLERAQDTLRQQGKDFGSVTIEEGAHKLKVSVRRRVEWEEGMLLKVLNSMDEDTARHYAQIKYTIPEAKYNNAPPEVKAALSEARTVYLQGVSVDIEGMDNA